MKKKHVEKKGKELSKYKKPMEDISYKNKKSKELCVLFSPQGMGKEVPRGLDTIGNKKLI